MSKHKDRFLKYLREYFTVYLPKQKNSSNHTITSCRQTWNLLLGFVAEKHSLPISGITFETLDRKTVSAFLDEMFVSRSWSHATYNQRLSCIRSFYKYAVGVEPILAVYRDALAGISLKKGMTSKVVSFMSEESVATLLRQPDTSTRQGIRDQFFMILMYDTAARNSEMLGMRLNDINAEKQTAYLLGKGSKLRQVPITTDTVKHFRQYIKIFHSDSDGSQPLFYSVHRKQKTFMSDDNVARFIRQYGVSANASCPDAPCRVNPHMLRHSRAMHLYRAGMPLALLSEWLGHEDPETTLIYAYADTEMKRKAIEKATANGSPIDTVQGVACWQGNEDIIQRLCGLM